MFHQLAAGSRHKRVDINVGSWKLEATNYFRAAFLAQETGPSWPSDDVGRGQGKWGTRNADRGID